MARAHNLRKLAFTEATGKEIIKALSLGALLYDAAAFAGIHRDTLYKWMKVGATRPLGDPLRAFADAVPKARAQVKVNATGRVLTGMSKDWKAAAWYLSVTDPANFGPQVKVTVREELDAALEKLAGTLSGAEYARVLAVLGSDDAGEGTAASVAAAAAGPGPGPGPSDSGDEEPS